MIEKKMFCIIQVNINNIGEVSVSFYAYNKGYGIHWTADFNDPDLIWYETKEEACKVFSGCANDNWIVQGFYREVQE